MKKLLVYMKGYEKECVLGPLFKLLEAMFELTVPLLTAMMVDNGIAGGDRAVILRLGAMMLTLAAVGLVCSVTAQYFAAKAATGFAARLRHALFAHIETLSFAQLDEVGTSTLITRMTSDINQVQSGVNMALRLFLRSPFIVVGAAVFAFVIDAKAALVFVLAIPVLALVIFGIMGVSMPLYKKVQQALDQVLLLTRENLSGVRVIRAFHRQEGEKKQFEEKTDVLAKAQLFVGRVAALTNPLTYVIVNLALVLLLWLSGARVDSGTLTQGKVIALVNYLAQILTELLKLANTIILTNKALACARRIQDVMGMESTVTSPGKDKVTDQLPAKDASDAGGKALDVMGMESTVTSPGEGTVPDKIQAEGMDLAGVKVWTKDMDSVGAKAYAEGGEAKPGTVVFDHVFLRYPSAAQPSVEDVSFTALPGQTVGIIGGTGAGKTSLVNLIPRFYDVEKGEVLVDGKDVRDYPLEVLRQKIGVVQQKAVLFSGTIRENLLWGRQDAATEEIFAALESAQALEFVQKKPKGVDSFVEQGGKNLSGGQRQRLSVARALLRRPEILILDDASSALDFATDAKLRQALKNLPYHPTMLIVSQRISAIRHADFILVMEDGAVVGKGTHEDLLKNCAVYREIVRSQERAKKEGA